MEGSMLNNANGPLHCKFDQKCPVTNMKEIFDTQESQLLQINRFCSRYASKESGCARAGHPGSIFTSNAAQGESLLKPHEEIISDMPKNHSNKRLIHPKSCKEEEGLAVLHSGFQHGDIPEAAFEFTAYSGSKTIPDINTEGISHDKPFYSNAPQFKTSGVQSFFWNAISSTADFSDSFDLSKNVCWSNKTSVSPEALWTSCPATTSSSEIHSAFRNDPMVTTDFPSNDHQSVCCTSLRFPIGSCSSDRFSSWDDLELATTCSGYQSITKNTRALIKEASAENFGRPCPASREFSNDTPTLYTDISACLNAPPFTTTSHKTQFNDASTLVTSSSLTHLSTFCSETNVLEAAQDGCSTCYDSLVSTTNPPLRGDPKLFNAMRALPTASLGNRSGFFDTPANTNASPCCSNCACTNFTTLGNGSSVVYVPVFVPVCCVLAPPHDISMNKHSVCANTSISASDFRYSVPETATELPTDSSGDRSANCSALELPTACFSGYDFPSTNASETVSSASTPTTTAEHEDNTYDIPDFHTVHSVLLSLKLEEDE